MRLLFSLIIISISFSIQAQQQLPTVPKSKNKFVVISHRGNHIDAPENTLKAYENAIAVGADFIEIDLRTTKDSQLVIMHDGTIDRMTNGKGKVKDFNLSELLTFQVEEKSKPEWGKFNIPQFEDVLNLIKNKINIYLDFKDADVLRTYQMLLKYGVEKQVIVYINYPLQAKKWMEIAPQIPLIVSFPNNIRDSSSLAAFLKQYPVSVLDGSFKEYNVGMVNAAHQNKTMVWPDIQHPNEAELWEEAIGLGVDGLQTDHPEALINFLKNKGIR
jgi:glycerophosphoryl diester phosphodiesterase